MAIIIIITITGFSKPYFSHIERWTSNFINTWSRTVSWTLSSEEPTLLLPALSNWLRKEYEFLLLAEYPNSLAMHSETLGIQGYLKLSNLAPNLFTQPTHQEEGASCSFFYVLWDGLILWFYFYCPSYVSSTQHLKIYSIHHSRLNLNTNSLEKVFFAFLHRSHLFHF